MTKHYTSAPLWRVSLTRGEQPIDDPETARAALVELGVEYDYLAPEDLENGVWLVGLVGVYGALAAGGAHVLDYTGPYVLGIPQG